MIRGRTSQPHARRKRRVAPKAVIADAIEPRCLLAAQSLSPLVMPRRGPGDSVAVGDHAFYVAYDQDVTGTVLRVMRTDGTPGGTTSVGTVSVTYSAPSVQFTPLANGRVVFLSSEPDSHGLELYSIDAAGTALTKISDFNVSTTAPTRDIGQLFALDGVAYLRGWSAATGYELYRTDGTAAGTTLVADALPGTGDGVTDLGVGTADQLFMGGLRDATTASLYVSDGTASGTRFVRDFASGYAPRSFAATAHGTIFFVNDQVWVSDGTARGTLQLLTLASGVDSRRFTMTSAGSFAVFDAGTNTYRTDGTPAGTVPLNLSYASLADGHSDFAAVGSAAGGGVAYVPAQDGLYRVNATGAPIELAGGGVNGPTSFSGSALGVHVTDLALVGEELFFNWNDTRIGRSDGTTAGTAMFDGRYTTDTSFDGRDFFAVGDRLMYSTSAGVVVRSIQDTPALPALSGIVFSDIDGDGVQDANEPGKPPSVDGGVLVDVNNDGFSTPVDWMIPLRGDGTFDIPWVFEGPLHLRAGPSSSAGRPTTSNGLFDLTAVAGQPIPFLAIGVQYFSTVTGSVRYDANEDGVAASTEPAAANAVVFLDRDGDGTLDAGEPQTTTNASGAYTFTNLAGPAAPIGVVTAAGMFRGAPAAGVIFRPTPEGAPQTMTTIGLIFHAPPPIISGLIFDDLDGDGLRDSSEAGVAGVRVWQDVDGDGVYDAGAEPTAVSDASGNYALSLPALAGTTATVRLRVAFPTAGRSPHVQPADVHLLGTPGERHDLIDVAVAMDAPASSGSSIAGISFADANANGVQDAGETPYAEAWVGIDLNRDGILETNEPIHRTDGLGRFRFDGLGAGSYRLLLVSGDVRDQVSTVLGSPGGGPSIDIADSATSVAGLAIGVSHIYITLALRTLAGAAFIDANANGIRDAATEGREPTFGVFFLDRNRDGVRDEYGGTLEPLATSRGSGVWGIDVPTGTYSLGFELPYGWTNADSTPAATSRSVTVGDSGATVDWGVVRARASTVVHYDRDAHMLELHLSSASPPTRASLISIDVKVRNAAGATVTVPAAWYNPTGAQLDQIEPVIRLSSAWTLRDGRYTVELGGRQIAASSELNTPPASFVGSFVILRGDADGDGAVTFNDLLTLARNYGKTGLSFSQGNFDYDGAGRVDFADLLVLAKNYGVSFAQASIPLVSSAAPTATTGRRATADVLTGPR